MEEKKISKPNFKASELVVDALKNAELVLHYCTETGLDVSKKNVETIIDAKRIYGTGNWTKEIEIEFWMAYKELTSLIKPINVDSLKASQEVTIKKPTKFQSFFGIKTRKTIAYRTVRVYTFFAVFTMLVMLFMHIYLSIGTIRLNKIFSSAERMKSIKVELDEMELLSDNNLNIGARQKQEKLLNDLYEVNTERESNIALLGDWVLRIQKLFFPSDSKPEEQLSEVAEADGPPSPPMAPEVTVNENIEVIQKAQNYVLVLGLYILPLFYGLLGALTFVLRDLSHQNKRLQYTKESNINHILRLILGTIAGLAVGVFWGDLKQQETFIVISSLGPLIVAYLSGLTVEYIFTGIERLVSSWFDRLTVKKD